MTAAGPQPNFANPRAITNEHVQRAIALGSRFRATMPHIGTLDKSEQEAVIHYKEGSYGLNKRLVAKHAGPTMERFHGVSMQDGISDTDYQTIHDRLKSGLSKISIPAPEHFNTFSGVSPTFGEKLRLTKPGDTFHSPAWVSTSLNPQVAHDFSSGFCDHPGMHAHVVQFRIPEGFKNGTYIGHAFGSFQHELEYTVHPDTKWKKVKTTKHSGGGYGDTYLHVLEPHVDD